MLDQVVCLSYF